jgi:CheY-like chemotaxis protein
MKVLIVDDIAVNRFILREFIKKLGLEYFEAENGLKAINIFTENDIELIFLDIEMPVMNGIETARKIRTSFQEPKNKVPIYALTAYHPTLLSEEVDISDFDGVINKPYSEEKIKSLFNKLLNK